MKGKVISMHDRDATRQPYIYIGRAPRGSKADQLGMHYGNPFSNIKPCPKGCVPVDTRDEAVEEFRLWINELANLDVEPQRRYWILENLREWDGTETVACFCAPQSCHGDVLLDLAYRRRKQ